MVYGTCLMFIWLGCIVFDIKMEWVRGSVAVWDLLFYNLFSDPQESFQRAWLQSSGDGGVVARRAMVTRSPDDQGCDIESAPVPGARPQLLMLTRLGHSSRRTLQNPPSCSPVQWSHHNGFFYDNFPQHLGAVHKWRRHFLGLWHPLVLMSAYHQLLACPLVHKIDDVICEQPRTKNYYF